ncbi:hypothetical protein [Crenobacter caeni]|uniref:Uncharacterized protein n=1 Tax=Crenobacter caeni TaxID=2705474 RepID=A0A6B2KV22_9NEIS|nr:hypothetical protein [Crenobacter caeni]NDV13954.1 hypothetical protein [Crenobacter caeni]
MTRKQKGKCPFCLESITPVLIEENTIRRDKCKCPKCDEEIYLCRSPGCHDFAKGTSVYDHELCPSCTDSVSSAAGEVGKAALKVGGAVLTAVLVAAASKKNK